MSNYVSIELFKAHVRSDDFADDDELLEHYLESAEESVIKYTNREASVLVDEGGNLPKPLVQAIMLLAAHWYNQREAASGAQMHSIPMGVQSLVRPYVCLVKESEE